MSTICRELITSGTVVDRLLTLVIKGGCHIKASQTNPITAE
jgi:hypothetical protein